MNSKTFCFVSSLFYPHFGGIERYTHQLSKKLVELGHKVFVLTANTENVQSFEVIDGISVYRLPTFIKAGARYPLLRPGRTYFRILNNIRRQPFDYFIINTRFYLTTLVGLKLAREKNIPAIIIEHGTGHFTVNNKVIDFFGRIYEKCITKHVKSYNPHFFGVSNACNNWLKTFNIESSGVLYNGTDSHYIVRNAVNLRNQYKIQEHGTIITFVGRLIVEKGVMTFFQAAKKLIVRFPDTYFFIAGSGPLLDSLKQSNVFPNNIFILGEVSYDCVMNLLQQSHILINPSNYPEGLPTILLEAGISKCAVIATPKGGTAELIINDNYGIMIEPGVEEDIVDAVVKLRENPGYSKQVTGNLFNLVSTKFNWDFLSREFIKSLN